MSAPLVPSPLDYIGRKIFAFYPPVHNATPNSWILGTGAWSEIQVINAQTGQELWLPRQYIGAVSDNNQALIVGLTQHLELRNSKLIPRSRRRVIEMPTTHAEFASAPHGPASITAIRLEKSAPSTFQKPSFRVAIFILFVCGLIALIASTSR